MKQKRGWTPKEVERGCPCPSCSSQDVKVLDDDDRIRIIANLIIDRVLEDKKNGVLKFTKARPKLGADIPNK